MSCCGLVSGGHRGGGCWLIVGDGGGGLVGGLLLEMVAVVGCCGLLGEWGHRGPLEVLVCCGLLGSAAVDVGVGSQVDLAGAGWGWWS